MDNLEFSCLLLLLLLLTIGQFNFKGDIARSYYPQPVVMLKITTGSRRYSQQCSGCIGINRSDAGTTAVQCEPVVTTCRL